jgi:hypothetical protein
VDNGARYTCMNSHLRLLKQLISDGMYVVDGPAVADAILARSSVRATVASASFRSEVQPPMVRSFRRDNHARSFRLERREKLYHSTS